MNALIELAGVVILVIALILLGAGLVNLAVPFDDARVKCLERGYPEYYRSGNTVYCIKMSEGTHLVLKLEAEQ